MFINTDNKLIWKNGSFQKWDDTNIHILSHTLHYGTGVFEGVRAYDTLNGPAIFRLKEHTKRLFDAAKKINIEVPFELDEIIHAQCETLNKNQLNAGYIRPIIYLGNEGLGLRAKELSVNVAIAAWEWGAYYGDAKTKGAKLDISKWNRPSPETIPSFAKAAGLYMICSMSKHSAEAKGCSDSLMRDYRGYVAEATGANIFFLRNGEVHTPLPDCFLNGITRQTIINILKKNGFKVFERHIEMAELEVFEQCWLTGTAAEVTPVGKIGDYNFEVGDFVKDLVLDYEKIVRD